MGLYLQSGYVDQEGIIKGDETFIFEIGGRGTGKTYGILQYALTRSGGKFLYLRRSQTETETVITDSANPFKALSSDHPGKWDITINKAGRQLFRIDDDGICIGYAASLSTFRNVRGIDFFDVDLIIFDEFIPEKGARPIKDEFGAFQNMYETVNRNRELKGEPPVKCICMANSNDIANPIFMGLGIVNRIGKMMLSKTPVWRDREHGYKVIMLMDSPIAKKKQMTALYRLTSGNDYSEMALFNIFVYDRSAIVSRSIKEYRPIVKIGELVVYRHKSRPEFYCNCKPCGTPRADVYTTSDADIDRFRGKYAYLYIRYMSNSLFFEDAATMVLFEKLFK